MTDVFFQALYMTFLPFFTLGMLVTLPFALSRGRVILKFAVTLGILAALGLLLLGLTVPYAAMGYFFVMYWLGPALMAGAVALLLTSKRMKTHMAQQLALAVLIVGGPFMLWQVLDKSSDIKTARKVSEQAKNEPALRKMDMAVGLGQHRLYLPLRSKRISVATEHGSPLSIRNYDDAKALVKLAKRVKKPPSLKAVYFTSFPSEDCRPEQYQNPAFWCDFQSVDTHMVFNVMWGGKITRPSYKSEATQEPDERGLIALPTSSKRKRHFLLPLLTTQDAIGHPIYLSCSAQFSKGTRMECSFSFAVSKTIKVSVNQVRGDEMEMANIVLAIQKDAQHILAELQKQP